MNPLTTARIVPPEVHVGAPTANPTPDTDRRRSGRLPERRALGEDVYQILREDLLTRRIAPGSRLNVDQLARELYVSNTPVRTALARLASEGLATMTPYRGFEASQLLDSRTIEELYDYRLLLEPPTAARAASRRSQDGLITLETMCADIESLLQDQSSRETISMRDCEFHGCIAEQAGNRVIAENLTTLMTRMSTYTLYSHSGAAAKAWQEHREILGGIRDKDPDGAADAMRSHLLTSRDRFRNLFD